MKQTTNYFIKKIDNAFSVWADINNGSLLYEITVFPEEKQAHDYIDKRSKKRRNLNMDELNKCTFCGREESFDTKIVEGYTILECCTDCEDEIING